VKSELSSVDVRALVRELASALPGARVDKAYQVGERELVLKLFGRGSLELVVAPNFMCLTRYKRPAPKEPTPFAMQLRKRLSGAAVRGVVQHGFDRIVELRFDEYVLILELFSRGNVILCDASMKILGLLDWQRWRDRTVGVGRLYEYPPAAADPFGFDEAGFLGVLGDSGRGVAATMATRMSLGGYWAERVCAQAGVDPKASSGDADAAALWGAFRTLLARLDGPVDARVFPDNVVPFGEGGEAKPTFNEAVDDYFSVREAAGMTQVASAEADVRMARLAEILRAQEEALSGARVEEKLEKERGDAIFQRLGEINEVAALVRDARRGGASDGAILESLAGYGFVRDLKGFSLTLEI
jgi:predicted ribosome quality control (RQC) complex YloA/Tae2 family protein